MYEFLLCGCKVVVLTKYTGKLFVGGVSCLNLKVQFNKLILLLLFYCFATNFLRDFVQNVPAKSGFLQMCLEDNLPDAADCGGLKVTFFEPGAGLRPPWLLLRIRCGITFTLENVLPPPHNHPS